MECSKCAFGVQEEVGGSKYALGVDFFLYNAAPLIQDLAVQVTQDLDSGLSA